jgi:hypothetical protein
MALPAPIFQMAHAVLGLETVSQGDPAGDEMFITAVKGEFPNLVNRQQLPPEMPSVAPRLLLTSTSSQLALSAAQVDFEVRFYGDYLTDTERGVDYVEKKLLAVLEGLAAAGLRAMTVGVIGTFRFSFREAPEGEGPARHILNTHLTPQVDAADIQDAMAKVAIRVRDTYFVNLTVSNYESRLVERPLMPGVLLTVRSWEGQVEDTGIELTVDINNLLEVREREERPTVTANGIGAVTRLLREVATKSGPAFVQSGVVSVDEMVAMSAT